MSVTPLTGQYAMFGEELQRGAEMAVQDVNARGGVNGEPLKLLVADDACDPGLAVQVAEELARQGVVFVDGHFCSGASMPASKVYHDKGVLMITPGSINPRLTEQGFANVFRICGRDDPGQLRGGLRRRQRARRAGRDRPGPERFGQGIADEFRERLNGRGVREAMDEAISQGDNDFGALIARMRDAGVRLVYFGGYHTEAGLFVRQARAQGLAATVMVNSAMVSREFWDLAGPGGEGTLMTFGRTRASCPPRPRWCGGSRPRATAPRATRSTPTRRSRSSPRRPGGRARPTSGRWRRRCTRAPTRRCSGPITFDAKGDVTGFEYAMYRWHDGRYEPVR